MVRKIRKSCTVGLVLRRGWAVVLLGCAGEIPAACGDDAKKDNVERSGDDRAGQADLPLRHLRRRGDWTDTLRMHEVIATARRSDDRALGRPEGRCGRAARPGILGTVDLNEPGDDGRAAQDERRRRHQGPRCDGATATTFTRVGDHLRALPLHGGQLVRCRASAIALDGWPNRDLNLGAIIALSPALTGGQEGGVQRRGARASTTRATTSTARTRRWCIPPAYGLGGRRRTRPTRGEGRHPYWNAYVAVTQMGGQGTFTDPRLGVNKTCRPDAGSGRAEAAGAARVPVQPRGAGTAGRTASTRRRRPRPGGVRRARCASCHSGAARTEVNAARCTRRPRPAWTRRTRTRTASKAYRTTPLRGLAQHPPYFHDGSAATLRGGGRSLRPGARARDVGGQQG